MRRRAREIEYAARDGEHFLDAVGNARVVTNAEAYYRARFYGGTHVTACSSWFPGALLADRR
jgi:hypothetical protein